MEFESSLTLTNSAAGEVILHLSPWGDQFLMSPASTLSIIAKAKAAGSFEVELLGSEIIVWAWPSASVKIFNAGVELGVGIGERPPVPDVPEGKSVSSFFKSLFGPTKKEN